MSVIGLVAQLNEKNVTLSVRGDELVVQGKRQALAPALLNLLRENKTALVELINAGKYVGPRGSKVDVPPNLIPAGCEAITPEMLPLIELNAAEIEQIVSRVPDGAANVQDIYPLAPLQEGILFHHLLETEGDVYLSPSLLSFDTRARLDRFLQALQAVIDRHDILRTAVMWEDLRGPVQVVWRKAPLVVEEVSIDPAAGDVGEELRRRFDPRHCRLDVRRAPLMRAYIAPAELGEDARERRWVMSHLFHHLSVDHTTFDILLQEIQAYLLGRADELPAPAPFRNFVAQARQRVSAEEHESFFRAMLGDVDEPTAPFGLIDVQGDGSGISEAGREVDARLAARLRQAARRLGVSAASLYHVAWAQVLARVSTPQSARNDVVFGTVLLGRMQGGESSDRVLGLVMNTLPIRIHVGDNGVEKSVHQTHQLLTELLRHEHAPLALAQRCSAVPAPTPLFSAYLNYRHSSAPAAAEELLAAWEGVRFLYAQQRANYPFNLDVDDLGDRFLLNAQVESPVDPARVCSYMHTALERLVEALDEAPTTPLRNLNVLPAAECHQQLVEWNKTERRYPQGRRIHQLFEDQVERTPEAVAVVFDDHGLTYRELNARSNLLAGALIERGVRQEALVGICMERSIETLVAMLGALKAGGAYLPLDPGYPDERLARILEEAGVKALLTQEKIKEKKAVINSWTGGEALCVAAEWEAIAQEHEQSMDAGVIGENLAYVLYTSGSTGRPKGVQINHRGLVNFTLAMKEQLGLREGDRILQFASLSFDVAAEEIYPALSSGATVVLAGAEQINEPAGLQRVLEINEVSGLELPAAYWHEWVNEVGRNGGVLPPALRFVILGCETPQKEKVRKWLKYGVRLCNVFGLTETTITNLVRWIEDEAGVGEESGEFSIGRPIANNQIYILNSEGMVSPVGVSGEIYIGGEGLGRGYQQGPDLTAERFVPNPFSMEEGARLYRTGDVGRYRPNGEVEFLGRRDHQVKVRGYRIELGEIESALCELEGVEGAVAAVREERGGDKRLVAYVAPRGDLKPTIVEMRAHLESRLPEYMAPSWYVMLERLPMTPNGKVDRRALPAPESNRSEYEHEAARTPVEEMLCGIWSDVLRVERVGVGDNFFELGGHSLLATQVISRVRTAFQVELPLRVLFEHPTISALAEGVRQALRGDRSLDSPPLVRAEREGQKTVKLPLSFAQQRLWFLDQLAPKNPLYNIPGAVRLEGRLDLEALDRVTNEIVRRHEALRTRIEIDHGIPAQVIEEWSPRKLEHVDLTHLARDEREAAVSRIAKEEAATGFNLYTGQLLRVKVLKLAEEEHVVLFTMHHIVSDGWSMQILIREVGALYQAYSRGESSPLEELNIQYADFAAWQREWLKGEALEAELEYWRKQLSGMEALELPADHPRPAVPSYRGARHHFVVERGLTERLRGLGQRQGVTLFMTMLGGFDVLLSRYNGQTDVTLGTDIANRNRAEIEGLIGFFVNQLALRVEVRTGESFIALLKRVREVCLGAYAHQDVPFEKLVEELQPERDLGRSPLFQAKLIWENAPREGLGLGGMRLGGIGNIEVETAKLDLTVSMIDAGSELIGVVEYSRDLFEDETIARLMSHYTNLLRSIAEDSQRPISELRLLSDSEREQITVEWNQTERPWPQVRCVHHLFTQQAEQIPDRIAAISDGLQVSYGELNRRANQLAHYLQNLGVGPEVVVGLCLRRSVEMVVAALGALKAGGAYLPLDPESPLERLGLMLEDAGVGVALTDKELEKRLPAFLGQTVLMDVEWERISRERESEPDSNVQADNLAYVIYTSGSTGRPKGVMINHQGLFNYLMWATECYRIAEGEGAPVSSSISFDLTVTSLYGPLVNGKRVNLLPEREGIEALARSLRSESGYSLVKITPAHLEALAQQLGDCELEGRAGALVIGGEELKAAGLKYWQERARGTRLINEYGPTETVVGCCVYEIDGSEPGSEAAPIGRPISNAQIYVLDRGLEPAPVGGRGEIYIAGAGLGRGYLGSPELTGEKFLPNRFSEREGDRMYRTGDIGRYLPDGNIECLGRTDNQVKVRGYRIELGEIEAVLEEHVSVKRSVVVVSKDESGRKRLLGYVVSEEGVTAAELKKHVRERLPEYMTPETITLLEEMPLSANGKIDRKRLPSASRLKDAGRRAGQEYVEARTPVEEMVVGIFEEALRQGGIGIYDNFFEIGGHSLLATQVVSRVRDAFGVEIGVGSIFESPTVEGLARKIEEAMTSGERDQAPPLAPVSREGQGVVRLPLSFAQQRLWFLDQLLPNNPFYNIHGVVGLKMRLDIDALERTINEIVRRHEVLRTRFEVVEVEEGEASRAPVQVISEWEHRRLEVEDLSGLLREEKEQEVGRIMEEAAGTGFDLSRGPLLRMKVLKLEEDESIALFTMHHIVSDGWSMQILRREIEELYHAYSAGAPSPLKELEIQYADFAVWQRAYLRGEVLEREVSYWKKKLQDAPAIELPADHVRPAALSYRGGKEEIWISKELSEDLRRLSQTEGATIFMVLMAAFKVVLMRWSGEEDLSIGTPIANRTRREVEGLIGFFVNTLVLRSDLSGNPSFKELIRRERDVALEAYAHQEAPFEKLVEEINPDRDLSRSPLFQVMMTLENLGRAESLLRESNVMGKGQESGAANFDLTLMLTEGSDGITGNLEYRQDLFEGKTIQRMARHYEKVVEEVVRDAEQRIREIELMSESERDQIVVNWNEIAVEYPRDLSIQELVEKQAAQSPERVAVVFEDQELSYRELNARANQLAHHLRALGVGPEALVGICVERSLEMIVGVLGILKAGGAYLPLDPTYPAERLGFMLKDGALPVVVTKEQFLGELPEFRAAMLCLDRDWPLIANQSEENPPQQVRGENLAYIIYTSGSTGQPKGVMVEHANVTRLFAATANWFHFDQKDVWTLFHSLAFDFSVWEIWGALIHGARLVVVPWLTTRSPFEFYQLLCTAEVTVLNQTPSAFRQLMAAQEASLQAHQLRYVVFGGEALEVVTLKPWYQEQRNKHTRMINMYGITETTVHVTSRPLEPLDIERFGSSPIGRRIPDLKIYLLDNYSKPVPLGVIGEMYIGGAGVARGYLNRPELTAERFGADPFANEPGARMYKTGDLARYLPSGKLEFLGRNDSQVKIRGYRIELGEIEAQLTKHSAVNEAVVTALENGAGDKRLVAYYTPVSSAGAETQITAEVLREHLSAVLPEHMVPSAYVRLEALPRTPSGKLDRRALPAPEGQIYVTRGYTPPVGETETRLAQIWAKALRLERVGRHDNFFELGGHSLMVIGLIERMRQQGLYTDIRTIYITPTLSALALAVTEAGDTIQVPATKIPTLGKKVRI